MSDFDFSSLETLTPFSPDMEREEDTVKREEAEHAWSDMTAMFSLDTIRQHVGLLLLEVHYIYFV